jgi:HlyD family secretion protein
MGKKKNKKKWLIIAGVVIVVVILVVANMTQSKRGSVTVQTKKVIVTDITSVVSGSGKVQPKTKVNVTAEATAEIINIPANEGYFVRKGQILIQLDTVQLKRDVESYLYTANEMEAHLEGAGVLLNQSKDEFERQKELYAKKLTSERAFKNADYAYRSQQASYDAMKQQKKASFARLEKVRDLLNKTTIKAPMDGIITWVDAEVGEIAQAQTPYSPGKPLMVVSDLSEFEVEVEIDETDIADLEVGQKSQVEIDAFPDTLFSGEVVEIGNTATISGMGSSDQAINFKVKVSLLDVHEKIRPGMSATVDITTDERTNVLAIPIQALVIREFDPDSLEAGEDREIEEEGNAALASTMPEAENDSVTGSSGEKKKIEKKGVFVNRDGVAKFVEVQTGISDQTNYEIAEGLEKGDEVIIGSFRILRTLGDGDLIDVDNTMLKRKDGQ